MNRPRLLQLPGPARAEGTLLVLFALVLVSVVALFGLAINLGLLYVRRTELQNAAEAAALAAASQLKGTTTSVNEALAQAELALANSKVGFGRNDFSFSAAALRFAEVPDAVEADWLAAGDIDAARASRIRYVRFDTTQLSGDPGTVDFPFQIGADGARATVSSMVVAGPTVTQAGPLAICAMSTTLYGQRDTGMSGADKYELVELGFRRGVTYNLLDLNPAGATAQSFLVNPLDTPDNGDNPAHYGMSYVRPFACTGLLPALQLDRLYVTSPFPASQLAGELNSRFNDYSASACNYRSAPPDENIRQYNGNYATLWITPVPTSPAAQPLTAGGTRQTVADPAPAPATNTAASYGMLWAYSAAVRYDAAAAGHVGAAFDKSKWPQLYPNPGGGAALASSWSRPRSPYRYSTGVAFTAPGGAAGAWKLAGRRVLNVPLLRCPVSGGSAEVLGVGRFLMMAKATGTAIYAEFGGLADRGALGNAFALYQ